MEDKFEREIEEILGRLDKFPRRGPADRARKALGGGLSSIEQSIAARLGRITLSQVMVTGIILVFVGYFFRSMLPFVWSYAVAAGLLLFFGAFVISFLAKRRGPNRGQIFWRGRPASAYSPSSYSIAERLRDWWRRHQPRRF